MTTSPGHKQTLGYADGVADTSTDEIDIAPSSSAGRNTTKARLISTAERLFAKKGIDAVSIRDVTNAAKANSAAIHYHFGSKHGLVMAVLEHRVGDLRDRREELLAEVESMDAPTPRDLARALVLPSAELANDRKGGQHYVVFVTALSNHAKYTSLVSEMFEPLSVRFLRLFETISPDLPAPVRAVRYAVATEVVNRVFSNLAALTTWLGEHADDPDLDIPGELIDFVAAALDGPVSR